MSTIKEVQEDIINEFEVFEDWMDRYNYLIELSNDLPQIDTKFKTNEYIIKGCQSKVWLNADYDDGKVVYTADSDAIITKGIISLLIRVLSNRSPKEIKETDLHFIDAIGLRENLSPTRANGLLAMIKQMKLYAIAYDVKFGNN
ncbi:MAG: SufE family protein [Bacteroidales bacterium]|nr:SufE family protein [Bacteroidales bacterium]MBN2817726.1 SufE family protein [Bacteroidales bacterium]